MSKMTSRKSNEVKTFVKCQLTNLFINQVLNFYNEGKKEQLVHVECSMCTWAVPGLNTFDTLTVCINIAIIQNCFYSRNLFKKI